MIFWEDAHNTADFLYKWKADDYGDTKKAVGVSQETSSIQFAVAGVNTRSEIVTFKNSKIINNEIEKNALQ